MKQPEAGAAGGDEDKSKMRSPDLLDKSPDYTPTSTLSVFLLRFVADIAIFVVLVVFCRDRQGSAK